MLWVLSLIYQTFLVLESCSASEGFGLIIPLRLSDHGNSLAIFLLMHLCHSGQGWHVPLSEAM